VVDCLLSRGLGFQLDYGGSWQNRLPLEQAFDIRSGDFVCPAPILPRDRLFT